MSFEPHPSSLFRPQCLSLASVVPVALTANMRGRMLDMLTEVRTHGPVLDVSISEEALSTVVENRSGSSEKVVVVDEKPLLSSSSPRESPPLSGAALRCEPLGRALRLSREATAAQEQKRLMDILGMTASATSVSCGSDDSGTRWLPQPAVNRQGAVRTVTSPREGEVPLRAGDVNRSRTAGHASPPRVVHRHHHHHYHHHYVLDPADGGLGLEAEELARLASLEESSSSAALSTSEASGAALWKKGDGGRPPEVQHVHRHQHSAEADIGSRARTLLDNAREAKFEKRTRAKGGDSLDPHGYGSQCLEPRAGPDTRLPRLS
ncbi:unnamed protein product [Polarella glacialis]|uniref:Uncharacterized protein n=1 Tax=Polarella glacialis TaxID=89957 RepID=A0A813KD10_POLGL|nr:unnamed protein product [Polarella glacialis]